MKTFRVLATFLLFVPLLFCTGARPSVPTIVPQATPGIAADVLGAMDRDADPCRDFYRYACGAWLDRTEIPPDQTRWGRSFSEIHERNRRVLRAILDEAARDPGDDPARAMLGTFYGACMDEERIEQVGIEPLRNLLEKIGKSHEVFALMKTAGQLHSIGIEPFFHAEVDGDFKDPSKSIAYFLQGGLGLPDRDFYLKEDEASRALLADYEQHVRRMFTLLGHDAVLAADNARMVVEFETGLARVSLPRAELREPEKLYHKIDVAGLRKLTPQIPWTFFLEGAGVEKIEDVSVGTPEHFQALESLVMGTRVKNLRAYLRWQLVHGAAPLLPRAFVEEDFAFFGKRIAGQEELPERWKRCVDAADEALGDLLGKLYVERAFAGNSKATAVAMIEGIEEAFRDGLGRLAWMDPATRQRAEEKLRAVFNKVGHPEAWRDYSSLRVEAGTHAVNVLAARNLEFLRQAAKVGKSVDRDEWDMTVATVNAYYDPSLNEMVFPAGIMQPPFFDATFPAPMNFGGIGMAMGHELTHGFDDQGRKFDASGKWTEWWEPEVVRRFEERARCVEDLYGTYEVQPGVKTDGTLTLGENIADLGGVKQSFRAYRTWAERHAEKDRAVPGLTNDQLFFVAFAQSWCTLETPEIERVLARIDVHAHPRYRVNGPLANLPDFARAFDCKEGSPMARPAPCEVW